MSRRNIVTDEVYHVFNRGVEKRTIFTNTEEYSYFVHLLYALNNFENVNNFRRNLLYKRKATTTSSNIYEGGPTSFIKRKGKQRLVDVLAFVLMENHYHLLLKQRVDGGISKFMQKIGTGYTMFFNEKYKRSGVLFQGKYKSVHIHSNNLLLYIPHYIHLNPVRHRKFSTIKEKKEYLETYKWSSYIDYVSGKNFPSVTHREHILSLFEGSEKYKTDIYLFLKNKKNFYNIDQSLLHN